MSEVYASAPTPIEVELASASSTEVEVSGVKAVEVIKGFAPVMQIYTIEGTTVTCTRNGKTIVGKQYGAVYEFELPAYGYYIFTYNDGKTSNICEFFC